MAHFAVDGSGGTGQRLVYRTVEAELAAAGGNKTITGGLPADAYSLMVRVEVIPANQTDTTGLAGGGVTGFAVGLTGDSNMYGDIVGTAIGTRNDWGDMTAAMPRPAATATDVLIEWAGGPPTSGRIRYTIHHLAITRD